MKIFITLFFLISVMGVAHSNPETALDKCSEVKSQEGKSVELNLKYSSPSYEGLVVSANFESLKSESGAMRPLGCTNFSCCVMGWCSNPLCCSCRC